MTLKQLLGGIMVSLGDFIEVSAQIGGIHHKNKIIDKIYYHMKKRKCMQIKNRLYRMIIVDSDIRDFILIIVAQHESDNAGLICIKDVNILIRNYGYATIVLPSDDKRYSSYKINIDGNEPVVYSGISKNTRVCINGNDVAFSARTALCNFILDTTYDICEKLIMEG